MDLKNLIEMAKKEVVEPETIRKLLPGISEEEFNRIEAILTVVSTNYPFENFFVFENTARALNNIVPRVEMLESLEPTWVWYACDMISKLRPNMVFSGEVIEYITKIFSDEGIYFLHPYVTKNKDYIKDNMRDQIYSAAKKIATDGPFPIEATSLINRQAIELMKMELYSQTMEKNSAR